jgi:GntR family transcriptional repressor for pyruvate dehydrogenase complex
MAGTAKKRKASAGTLSRELTRRLLRRIIDGVYPAGTKLPTERVLAEEFGVARTVVREALKRIEAFGMLTIRQGSGALVEDFQTVGGIELADLLMYRRDGSMDEGFLEDAMKLHEYMHRWLVMEAAARATRTEIEELRGLLKERALLPRDREERNLLTFEITRRIIQASHNRYLILLFNTLARTTRASRTVFELPVHFDPGIQVFFERLVEAFDNRDPEMAELLTARVFEENRETFVKAMSNSNAEGGAEAS